MKKSEEVANIIVQATIDYTELYCDYHKTKKIDKQIWAALHTGMYTAFLSDGYDASVLDEALGSAQDMLKTWQEENGAKKFTTK